MKKQLFMIILFLTISVCFAFEEGINVLDRDDDSRKPMTFVYEDDFEFYKTHLDLFGDNRFTSHLKSNRYSRKPKAIFLTERMKKRVDFEPNWVGIVNKYVKLYPKDIKIDSSLVEKGIDDIDLTKKTKVFFANFGVENKLFNYKFKNHVIPEHRYDVMYSIQRQKLFLLNFETQDFWINRKNAKEVSPAKLRKTQIEKIAIGPRYHKHFEDGGGYDNYKDYNEYIVLSNGTEVFKKPGEKEEFELNANKKYTLLKRILTNNEYAFLTDASVGAQYLAIKAMKALKEEYGVAKHEVISCESIMIDTKKTTSIVFIFYDKNLSKHPVKVDFDKTNFKVKNIAKLDDISVKDVKNNPIYNYEVMQGKQNYTHKQYMQNLSNLAKYLYPKQSNVSLNTIYFFNYEIDELTIKNDVKKILEIAFNKCLKQGFNPVLTTIHLDEDEQNTSSYAKVIITDENGIFGDYKPIKKLNPKQKKYYAYLYSDVNGDEYLRFSLRNWFAEDFMDLSFEDFKFHNYLKYYHNEIE